MKVRIADMDGTILRKWEPGNYDPVPSQWALGADAILTNQGGVALNICGWDSYYGLPIALKRVKFAMWECGAQVAFLSVYTRKQLSIEPGKMLATLGTMVPPIEVDDGIYVSFAPYDHKPKSGGLIWLARYLGAKRENVIFYGDSDDDEGAAKGWDCAFVRMSE